MVSEEQPYWYKSVMDNLSEGLYVTNTERRILYWNHTAEDLSGFQAEQVVGSYCYNNILMHVDENGVSLCQTMCPLARTILDGQVRTDRVFLHHADGHRVPVIVRINPIFDSEGKISGAAELFSNDSASLSALERINELEKAALLDPLTEVGNRRYTEKALTDSLAAAGQDHTPYGALFLDVDHFKAVNDDQGHLVGDRVLRMVAKTVQHNLHAEDFIGRWGGDEFLVILHNIEAEHLRSVANKMRVLIATAQLMLDQSKIRATVSIGGTPILAGDTVETILDRMDQGLYSAKAAGRNQVKVIFP